MTNIMRDADASNLKSTAVIPVRAGSKRVSGKNIREFKGQPLLVWSIKAAMVCPQIDEIIVTTDDPRAAEIAEDYPVTILDRPSRLASDMASTFDVLRHVILEQGGELQVQPDALVLLQATSPLRERNLISNSLQRFAATRFPDRLLELNALKLFSGTVHSDDWNPDYPEATRSQDIPETYFPSGRIFIYNCDTTIREGDPEGRRCSYVLGDYATNINIDAEQDFEKLDFVYSRYEETYKYLLD